MNELEIRIEAIKALVEIFKVERYVYMCSLLLCIVVLLTVAIIALNQNKIETTFLVGLFAPTGGIMYMVKNLLSMYNDAYMMATQNQL